MIAGLRQEATHHLAPGLAEESAVDVAGDHGVSRCPASHQFWNAVVQFPLLIFALGIAIENDRKSSTVIGLFCCDGAVRHRLAPDAIISQESASSHSLSPPSRPFQNRDHRRTTPGPRVPERGRALPVRNGGVGPGCDERPHRLDVARAAVAEDRGFDQGGPAEIVDMIERRAGADQFPHHAIVAEVRGGDQGGAVVDARDDFALAPLSRSVRTIAGSSRTAAIVTAS